MYIEVKKQTNRVNLKLLDKLPKKVLIAYSIQFKALASKVKTYLKGKKKDVVGVKQVLGCS
ncbi:MAG: hypothetical protein KAS32_01635, partial [Candidatus Peribacteraceae bacterium]|nr:hypothetical protein [Candidatus Peribacteraceae bacterium]